MSYRRKNPAFSARLCAIADSRVTRAAVATLPVKHRRLVQLIVAVIRFFKG